MSLEDIEKLIQLLKREGVATYKDSNISLTFDPYTTFKPEKISDPVNDFDDDLLYLSSK